MRLSIITPTLNRAHFLEEAIESVRAQDFPDCEHLIVDGGSTDGTLEMLARHPHLRVVSEPDRGLYDALNKGLRMARGEIVGLLNSDDLQPAGTLAAVAGAFDDPVVEMVSGGIEIFPAAERTRTAGREALILTLENAIFGQGAINARFFRRSLIERVGFFDLRYRIAADREWLLRAALLEPRETWIERIVCRYREHDESMTFDRAKLNAARYRQEHLAIAEEYLRKPEIVAATRRTLRRWHQRESVCEAQQALLRGEFSAALAHTRRGCRISAGWPLAYVVDGSRGLAERMGLWKPS